MQTQLAKQILARLKAKNITVNMLEREAGLKPHSVVNIIRGTSKKPSAEILQAVADVLGCDIRDLLGNQDLFIENENSKSKAEILESSYEMPELLKNTLNSINERLEGKENLLTTQQVLTCVQEIYLHSLQKTPPTVDNEFADWFIGLMLK